ncbi:MAG: SGNH/GDSL hydrolase family protein [Saprospiraceae bacterium]|nr:SGNH/GDSL hydrolase family protein [Saprospiraceae bacterium]
MIKNILPLLFAVIILSCINQEDQPFENTAEVIPNQSIQYLALGDSYTIGEGVAEELRWPNQLSKKLMEQEFDVTETDIIAQTGWTTKNLQDAIANTSLKEYNLVSLLIGVNNQYQNKPFEVFEKEFVELLDQSIEIAGNIENVFVVSIPDYGVTPFGSSNSVQIGMDIDKYNGYIAEQCTLKNIPFIDITEISRTLGDDSDAVAADKLHPSGFQYLQWTNEILPVVVEMLQN